MTTIDWRIPPSMRRWLADVPADQAVAVLLRHSVRDYLPPGEAGWGLPITEVGAQLAHELGALLGDRLRTLHASPLPRCVQTAEALRAGAVVEIPIFHDRLLGDPGIYVIDGTLAWSNWQQLGHEGVMKHLVSQQDPLPGMADADPAAQFLVQHMLAAAEERLGLHVFVTHDSLITATAARLLREPLGMDAWPWYLEGAFFWRTEGQIHVAYRDYHKPCSQTVMSGLNERSVIDFARREVARTVGTACDARFFLAGGAYKSLLTGRPPRDLDLWAPSMQDREMLISALAIRGASRLDCRPFADSFEIGGRMVEVSHRAEYETLEALLARFDIALSAIGAEHQPRDLWTAIVHPLARESAERQEVLLLKPLVNWKYALATLERLRRYALELGYHVPPEEEAEVWRVFESQSDDMRLGMLERLNRTALGGYSVCEEAKCCLG